MQTRPHPTHHASYNSNRTFVAVLAGLIGVFLCVFLLTTRPGDSAVLRLLKTAGLWGGGLAFIVGILIAAATEIPHRFTRCPSCQRTLWRSRIDCRQSYYECSDCETRWTCPCSKAAD
jgi:hypothetical protein